MKNVISFFGKCGTTPAEIESQTHNVQIQEERELSLADVCIQSVGEMWSPWKYEPKRRSLKNAASTSLLVLDIDGNVRGIERPFTLSDARAALKGLKFGLVTTRSHQISKTTQGGEFTPACDRFRVILPLSRLITDAGEYAKIRDSLSSVLGFVVDPLPWGTWFFPSKEAVSMPQKGREVDVDAVLEHGFKALESDDDELHHSNFSVEGLQTGYLSRLTRSFLVEGCKPGGRNAALFKATCDLRDQGYTAEWSMARCRQALESSGGWEEHEHRGLVERVFKEERELSFYRPRIERPVVSNLADMQRVRTEVAYQAMGLSALVYSDISKTVAYEIVDSALMECRLMINSEFIKGIAMRETVKAENFAPRYKNQAFTFGPLKPEDCLELWRSGGLGLKEEPKPFRFKSEEGWALKKLAFDVSPAPFPAWEEFLSRLSDRKAFMAWVWSVFEMSHQGRQCLYLFGPHGQDGKSVVCRVLSDALGEAATVIQDSQVSNNSRFVFSSIYGKRFILYPDCKSPTFIRSETFRNLTGSDKVLVEFKGQNPFTADLNVRLAICSNYEPAVTHGNADKSRILPIIVARSEIRDDSRWAGRLKEELGGFLYSCREEYKAQGLGERGQIVMSEHSANFLDKCANTVEEKFESVVRKYLKIGATEQIGALDFYDFLCVDGHDGRPPLKERDYKKFMTYLRARYSIMREYLSIGDVVVGASIKPVEAGPRTF